MGDKQELVSGIVAIEWNMFQNVNSRGGRASCQDDRQSFELIRISNFLSLSEATLQSYMQDLEEAKVKGRNLLTEKYARMEGIIPTLNPEALPIIDKIVDIECNWAVGLSEKYPYVYPARPVRSVEDTPYAVSSETYSRGELETYSKRTLELYYNDLQDMQSQNINRLEVIYGNMVKRMGYESLDQANEAQRKRSQTGGG